MEVEHNQKIVDIGGKCTCEDCDLDEVMTLDEAIKHCEEKCCGNTQCNQEHKQLAEWLKELKLLRKEKTEMKAMSAVCEDCGDWFAVEEEALNDNRIDKIKCPVCQSNDIRKLGIIIYR